MEGNEPFVTTQDKVVISDLLFFIMNKYHTHPVESIIGVCDSFYDDKTVAEEKSKFFSAISEKCPARRNNDKKVKDLEDILNKIKS